MKFRTQGGDGWAATANILKIGMVKVTLHSKKYWHSDIDTLHEKNIGTGTVTLCTRNVLAQWHFAPEKYWHSDTLHEKNIGTVTLYTRKMLAQWQWHFAREKYWHSDSETLHEKNIGTVTVTLYTRKIVARWQWHLAREKYWHSDSDTLLETKHWHGEWHFIQGRQLISVRTFQVSRSILEIFVTEAPQARALTNCVFYGSRGHERQTLLVGANKMLPRCYTSCPIRTKFGARNYINHLTPTANLQTLSFKYLFNKYP
jgi:hypothetical protein